MLREAFANGQSEVERSYLGYAAIPETGERKSVDV